MSFIFNCPYCQQGIEAEDEWIGQEAECPGCGKTIKIEKNKPKIALKPINQQSGFQPQYGQQQFVQQQNFASGAGALTVMPAGPGTFNVSGDYFGIYTCVRQIFQECGWRIKEDNPAQGRLAGSCKYGINPSGIGVTAVFYLNGNAITLEFSASLSNAVDTMGLCSQKVAEFSTRLMELAPVFVPDVSMSPAAFPAMPPDFSRRIGESYAGKAKNALLCAVLGLLCAIFAVILAGRAAMAFIAFCALMGIFAMIFAGQALTGMSKSRNDEGKGFAIAAMFLGFIEIIVMGGFFFLRYFLR